MHLFNFNFNQVLSELFEATFGPDSCEQLLLLSKEKSFANTFPAAAAAPST